MHVCLVTTPALMATVRDGIPVKGQIPRVKWTEKEAWDLLESEQPVILLETGLADVVLEKWTVYYLAEHMKGDVNVFSHDSHKCKYHDRKRHTGPYPWNDNSSSTLWKTSMKNFVKLFRGQREGEEGLSDVELKKFHYCQESLTTKSGEQIINDAKGFKWMLVEAFRQKLNLGPMNTNMLLVGPKDVNTPAHYDEQHNFFYQVAGRKEMILWSPNDFNSLYPYPVDHSHDRQSQVDIDNVDEQKFPKARKAQAMVGIVGPGEVLYIPPYWWHDVTSLDETISITFWMTANNDKLDLSDPTSLKPSSYAATRRNLEKMISSSLSPELVPAVFKHASDPELIAEVFSANPQDKQKVEPLDANVGKPLAFAKQILSLVKILIPNEKDAKDFFDGLYLHRFSPA